MNTQPWQLNLNNLQLWGAISSGAIVLICAAPIHAQIIVNENRTGVSRHIPANYSTGYDRPNYNTSTIYGSPIPAPSIGYPNDFYTYPRDYPGSVTRVRDYRSRTLTNPILVNPTIQDSTLINPTIIQVQPQRRYGEIDGKGQF